jgi:hypothetical protein
MIPIKFLYDSYKIPFKTNLIKNLFIVPRLFLSYILRAILRLVRCRVDGDNPLVTGG